MSVEAGPVAEKPGLSPLSALHHPQGREASPHFVQKRTERVFGYFDEAHPAFAERIKHISIDQSATGTGGGDDLHVQKDVDVKGKWGTVGRQKGVVAGHTRCPSGKSLDHTLKFSGSAFIYKSCFTSSFSGDGYEKFEIYRHVLVRSFIGPAAFVCTGAVCTVCCIRSIQLDRELLQACELGEQMFHIGGAFLKN